MAKSQKRKRNGQGIVPSEKIPKVTPALPSPDLSDDGPKHLSTVVSQEELEITVDTLQTLAEHPSVIKSKPCKELRAAVFDFRQACTTGVNTAAETNLTARISAAITDGKYTNALVLLAEMRIRREAPKLGALCRWVRDLDVVSGFTIQDGGDRAVNFRSATNMEKLKVLDYILRVTGPTDLPRNHASLMGIDPIEQQMIWNHRHEGQSRLRIRESVLDGSIFKEQQASYQEKFQIIETTEGPQRKPPNLHPAYVYLTSDDAVPLSPSSPCVTRVTHPCVDNLSLLKDVLFAEECKLIIAAAESIGFLPDAPSKHDGTDSSILAHNVYWMVDQAFHDKIWSRVYPFIPSNVNGRKARSINRRFRVYRYVPGAEYRCHIDGAWPPSGIHPVTKMYQYDASPPDAKQSSLFTFLIYLNDEFEGGETTFFVPSLKEGVINAYPVKPVIGSVAMFPHGETKGALLHEGTGVKKGAKYVIRTDVEYDVVPTPDCHEAQI